MEKLKSTVPENIKHDIFSSNLNNLESTSFLLLNHFQDLPLFHQMVRELTDTEMALCGKDKDVAFEAKAKGNECFHEGDYSGASRFYTKALRVAPIDANDLDKNLLATLYVNRATSLHKLGLFVESLRDCRRALMIFPAYAKAWFRRGKANSSLGKYEDAIRDLNITLNLETSMSRKKLILSELNTLSDNSRVHSIAIDKLDYVTSDEPLQTELLCVSTPHKGRGMTSSADILPSALIHREDPYAAIIVKHCRETHCAFCFEQLPEDAVPCLSCSIPLYCSVLCQVQAGGREFPKYEIDVKFQDNLPEDLERHVRNVTSLEVLGSNHKHTVEHSHECHGSHWAAVLPSDVVLAGRIIVKHLKQRGFSGMDPEIHIILDLCQNYYNLSSEAKLEFHVYAIVLLCCLRSVLASKLPLNSSITSQIIILLSQVRVNSMAIVRMKDSGTKKNIYFDATSSVEQVKVAQAVYPRGSLYNHSCQPNVNAYFISRTLFLRATEHIRAGVELEVSYGPQVGQWNCDERRQLLEDRYSFICHCRGCDEVNLSDVVRSAYRCNKENCFGVVLNSCVAKHVKEKQKGDPEAAACHLFGDKLTSDHSSSCIIEPGCCLGCSSLRDLKSSENAVANAEINLKRLQDAINSGEIGAVNSIMDDAVKSRTILRGVLHPFNKKIAEAEDNIAQGLCLVGREESAIRHCRASFEILEKLYGGNHIVIGHELIKIASLASATLAHAEESDEDMHSTNRRISAIFMRHYGSHAEIIFPPIRYFNGEKERASFM